MVCISLSFHSEPDADIYDAMNKGTKVVIGWIGRVKFLRRAWECQ